MLSSHTRDIVSESVQSWLAEPQYPAPQSSKDVVPHFITINNSLKKLRRKTNTSLGKCKVSMEMFLIWPMSFLILLRGRSLSSLNWALNIYIYILFIFFSFKTSCHRTDHIVNKLATSLLQHLGLMGDIYHRTFRLFCDRTQMLLIPHSHYDEAHLQLYVLAEVRHHAQ